MSVWIICPLTAWANGGESAPAQLFDVYCAGCHPNGANIIRRGKNLKQRALKRHGYDSVSTISALITNGKGLMSAYGDQLTEQEIQSLASYVLEQAENNWRSSN
ncbi:MAG: c-type cytochrome [Cyanobacteria bacterium P01_D01_bin.56]